MLFEPSLLLPIIVIAFSYIQGIGKNVNDMVIILKSTAKSVIELLSPGVIESYVRS